MMHNILILNGNPKSKSFCAHLSEVYELEAKKGASVRRFDLSAMQFNPSLDCGYDDVQALEPCLSEFQEALLWAHHIVIVAPIWWGGLPSKLKGLIERTFLPSKTFKYDADNSAVIPLLTGKTSRLILTMDAPEDFAEQQAAPVIAQLNQFTLQFCGVACLEPVLLSSVSFVDEGKISEWRECVRGLGSKVP